MNVEKESERVSFTDVYYIESSDTTMMLAFDLEIQGAIISWFDTIKMRNFEIKQCVINESNILVSLTNGTEIIFRPITLDIYNQQVKERLLAPKDFTDLNELKEALIDTKKYA